MNHPTKLRWMTLLVTASSVSLAQGLQTSSDEHSSHDDNESDDLEVSTAPDTSPSKRPSSSAVAQDSSGKGSASQAKPVVPDTAAADGSKVDRHAVQSGQPQMEQKNVGNSPALLGDHASTSSHQEPRLPLERESTTPAFGSHVESPSGWGGLKMSGYLQIDYQHSQASADQIQQGNGPMNQNRFLLRRGRLRVDRFWDWAAATLELDANTVSGMGVGIRRAEGSLFYQGANHKSLPPLVKVAGGVTDIPFGHELGESAHIRVFMERSSTSAALFPTEMDVGLKISGAAAFLRYGVAVSNGEPVDNRGFPRDPNNAKDIVGHFGVVVPVRQIFEVTGGVSFATGKGFHAGSAATKSSIVWRDDNQDGVATSDELIGAPGVSAQPAQNFDRWALGLDLGFRFPTRLGNTQIYGEIYAASNYDRNYLVSDPVTTGVDVRQLGGYAAIIQQVTPYGVAGFRLSLYDPNADIFEERQGKLEPKTQTVRTISLLAGLTLPERGRLLFEYDFIHDYLARDSSGVPTDARNDTWTARLQVNL